MSHPNTFLEDTLKEFEKKFEHSETCRVSQYETNSNECWCERKDIKSFLTSKLQEAEERGRLDAMMDESIKRYNQAKEDGTLDKHFPKI